MTFFYDINKKLQQVLETPKSDHMQLNEDLKQEIPLSEEQDITKL